jgi:hypothetical protein
VAYGALVFASENQSNHIEVVIWVIIHKVFDQHEPDIHRIVSLGTDDILHRHFSLWNPNYLVLSGGAFGYIKRPDKAVKHIELNRWRWYLFHLAQKPLVYGGLSVKFYADLVGCHELK